MVTAPLDTAPYSEAARRMLRPEECALAVIDIQEKLLQAIFEKERVVRNAQLLVRLADILTLPVIVSRQYVKGPGTNDRRNQLSLARGNHCRQNGVWLLWQ
jgi:nicotinamidase-related amidase